MGEIPSLEACIASPQICLTATRLWAGFSPNPSENKSFAERIGLSTDRVYDNFELLIEEELKRPVAERMEVISVLTPNFLHFPMAKNS